MSRPRDDLAGTMFGGSPNLAPTLGPCPRLAVPRPMETLINRRLREVVGNVGGEWPDTNAKRRPSGEV